MTNKKLSSEEKSRILLEVLNEFIQVDYSFEKYYLKALKNGLNEIDNQEKQIILILNEDLRSRNQDDFQR